MTSFSAHPPGPPSLRRKSVYALVALVLVLAALELGTRAIVAFVDRPELQRTVRDYGRVAHGQPSSFSPDPEGRLAYRLTPGWRSTSPGGAVTAHNLAGYRDHDEPGEKKPTTLRIVCIGGSTTYGSSVRANEATYPAVLERRLAEEGERLRRHGWEDVEVLNLGVGGYTTVDLLPWLRTRARTLDPDVVLVQCGINDVTPRLHSDFRPDYSHWRRKMEPVADGFLARLAYRSRLLVVVGWATGLLGPLTLQTRTETLLPDLGTARVALEASGASTFDANVRALIDATRDMGAVPWLLTQPYLDHGDFRLPDEPSRQIEVLYQRGLREHVAVLRALPEDAGVGLFDLARRFPKRRAYFADPIHMTSEGNRAKAARVAKALLDDLPEGPSTDSAR